MNQQTMALIALSMAWSCFIDTSIADTDLESKLQNRMAEVAAKDDMQTQGIHAKALVTSTYPAGTAFYITALHPLSSSKLLDFQGVKVTATTCRDGVTSPGINLINSGDRKGWYDACFTKPGDKFEYYLFGFKFSLDSPNLSVNPETTFNGKTGELVLPKVEVGADNYSAILMLEGNNLFRLQRVTKQ